MGLDKNTGAEYIPKNTLVQAEVIKQLTEDHFTEVAQVSGELYGVIENQSIVKKLQSTEHPDTFVAYKPRQYQGNLRRSWGPDVWITGDTVPNREVAAFIVSDFLNFNLVPVTALAEGPNGEGSIQYWIDGRDGDRATMGNIDRVSLIKAATFIHAIGGIDVHARNIKIDSSNNQKLIDNGLSFPVETTGFYNNYEVTLPVSGETIPDIVLEPLVGLFVYGDLSSSGNELKSYLDHLLGEEEVNSFFVRVKELVDTKKVPNPLDKQH